MQKITKLLNILTIVMLVVTVVLVGLFYFGGELPKRPIPNPRVHGAINLVGIRSIRDCNHRCHDFPDRQIIYQTKTSDQEFNALVGIIILVLIAYSISDGTVLNLPGYDGADNVPGTLKFADTILFTMYFLGIGAIGAIIVTEIIRRMR